jgi:hypothetical protein
VAKILELVKNPFATERHALERSELVKRFPDLASEATGQFLALRTYLHKRPECFFDDRAFEIYLTWLKTRDGMARGDLVKYLRRRSDELDGALLFLREINQQTWHDEPLEADGEFGLVRLIDQRVHPAYLRLVEAVLVPLLRVVAHFSRLDRNAGTDGLNVWNVVQELTGSPEAPLVGHYRHVMRNGIAHGGITYLMREIRYHDRAGKQETLSVSEIIRLCDDLLDVCNGLAAALKVFLLTSKDLGYPLPRELVVEELDAQTETPWWTIEGCVESEVPAGRQFLVYAKVNSRDYRKVAFSAIHCGILAESLVRGYQRYFVALTSDLAPTGWAAFDGVRLADLRKAETADPEQYRGVLENSGVFFSPWRPMSRVMGRVDTFVHAVRAKAPTFLQERRAVLGIPDISPRGARMHRNAWGAVLNGSVVLRDSEPEQIQDVIRRNRRRIVRAARKSAQLAAGESSLVRRLPLAYARVAVFRRDYRIRRLTGFGLGADLICTVQLKRMARIRAPDLAGSTVESTGKWRIAWNRGWLELSATHGS